MGVIGKIEARQMIKLLLIIGLSGLVTYLLFRHKNNVCAMRWDLVIAVILMLIVAKF